MEKWRREKNYGLYQIDGSAPFRYLEIQKTDSDEWDYTLYADDFRDIDGGRITQDAALRDVRDDILRAFLILNESTTVFLPYQSIEELREKAGEKQGGIHE